MKNIFLTLPSLRLGDEGGSRQENAMNRIIVIIMLFLLMPFGVNAEATTNFQNRDTAAKLNADIGKKLEIFQCILNAKTRAQKVVCIGGSTVVADKGVVASTSGRRLIGGVKRDAQGLHHWTKVNGSPAKKAYKSFAKQPGSETWIGKKVSDDLHAMKLSLGDYEKYFRPIFNEIRDSLGLLKGNDSEDHRKQWEAMLKNGMRTHGWIKRGDILEALSFRKGVIENVIADFDGYLGAYVFPLENGRELLWIPECGNFAVRGSKAPPAEPVRESTPPKPVPVSYGSPPPLPEKQSAFYNVKVQGEVGAWLFHGATRNADWKGGGGEAMGWLRFGQGDQYAVGVGPIGSVSYGSAKEYRWNEHYVGLQVGFRRDFWNEEHRPTGYGVKLRALWDNVEGGDRVSGYGMRQSDVLIGGYAEVVQQRGPRWTVGAQISGSAMVNAKQVSTWKGDKPQDRSSVGANIFAEYFLHRGRSETFGKWWLSLRGNLGASYQFWDEQGIAPISLQLRLGSKEWGVFGCGVQVGLPIGRSAQYTKAGVPWGDLVSLTEFCNYNYGGIVQRLDGSYRQNQVVERNDIRFESKK